MVQRRTARRIKRDFRPTSSASEMVKELKLANLKTRRTVDKTTMLYKKVHGLVEIAAAPGMVGGYWHTITANHLVRWG